VINVEAGAITCGVVEKALICGQCNRKFVPEIPDYLFEMALRGKVSIICSDCVGEKSHFKVDFQYSTSEIHP